MTDGSNTFIHNCIGRSAPVIRRKRPRLDCPTVDMHCHLFVPEVQRIVAGSEGERLEANNSLSTFGPESLKINEHQIETIAPKLTKLDVRLADMDAMGVDIQVLSVSPTQYYYSIADREMACAIADAINTRTAEVCNTHPDRLIGMGSVSLQFPELAARQLEHAICSQGLCGVEISTHVAGENISDRRFDPFWQKADELGAIVFLHPWGTTVGERLSKHYLGNTVGNPMETAIALSNLIFNGTLDRNPGLKIVGAHGGGYLPTYITRSDHAFAHRPDACGCSRPPSDYLKQIWVDSLVYDQQQLRRLIEVMGASQIVLGTDYPFDMGHYEVAVLLNGLNGADLTAIAGGNALALLETVGRKSRNPAVG